jgi:hypothetical protein
MSVSLKFAYGLLLAAGFVALAPDAAFAQTAGAAKNQALIDSRKRITEAQQIVTELKADQKRIKDKKQAEFEAKEEWKNTVANHKKAKTDYENARKAALGNVQKSAAYKQALKDKEAVQAKMEALNGKRDADPEAIQKLGSQLAVKALVVKKMETEAATDDAKTLDAKDALDVADKNMKALEEEVEAALATDPDYAALLTQIEQAETQVAQAKEADIQARKAARPPPPPPKAPKAPRASKRSAGGGY